jgi:hypothetical protein
MTVPAPQLTAGDIRIRFNPSTMRCARPASPDDLSSRGVPGVETGSEDEDLEVLTLFVCSDHARHITGQIVVVDGGSDLARRPDGRGLLHRNILDKCVG